MNVVEVLAAVAVVVVVIVRQVRGDHLRARRVVVLPAILVVLGSTSLAHSTTRLHAADIACIATGSVVAAAIGAGQGYALRLSSRDGALWGRMPVAGLWLWAGLIASRLLLVAVAVPLGASVAASSAPILLTLGINRIATAAVVGIRAAAMGVPFAAEPSRTTRRRTASTRPW